MTTDSSSAQPAIAVGIDGSAGSTAALQWALNSPSQLGPVEPVAISHVPIWRQVVAGSAAPMLWTEEEIRISDVLASVLDDVGDDARPRLRQATISEGSTSAVLARAGERCGTLVIGTRSRGPVADTLRGSVSVDCAAHALSPVVVVPEEGGDPNGPVVVGVDGSPHSTAALRWALEHHDADVPIIALGVWTFVVHGMWQEMPHPDDQSITDTEKVVTDVVTRVLDEAGAPAGRVTIQVEHGDPRTTLHRAGATARLLVLGSRGATGWQHALLGSVTTALLHQPSAPTAVIPAVD